MRWRINSIQLLKPGVLALELGDEGFHFLHHREDLDTKGYFGQYINMFYYILIDILTNRRHPNLLVRGLFRVLLVVQ